MDPENFNGSSGKVIKAETQKHGSYYTFIPNQLPVSIDLNNVAELIEEATLQLGKLNGIAKLLPNPYLFTKLYTQKEAVMSSRIEGTRSSLEDVLIAAVGGEGSALLARFSSRSDLLEVLNLIRAANEGVKSIETEEMGLVLLLRLHRILMKDVRGGERNSGSIRQIPNWIGAPGTRIHDARYVPPPPEYVPELLDNLLKYLNAEDSMPRLIKIAIAHYQFEAIHPFEDGNGRIGRLLLTLYMMKVKVLDLQLLYLSEYFEKNRARYYDLLFKVSQQGTYEEWVSFFLKGIVEQTNKVIVKAELLLRFSEATKDKLGKERSTHVVRTFEALLSNPYITIPNIARMEGISYPAAKGIANKLVNLGVLKGFSRKGIRGQIFVSEQILRIVEDKELEV